MTDGLALIPQPRRCERGPDAFRIGPRTPIYHAGPAAADAAELLAARIERVAGFAPPVAAAPAGHAADGAVLFRQTADPAPDAAGFLPEAHACAVTASGIAVEAASSAGLARGGETLRQLLPTQGPAESELAVPGVRIEDEPRFRWRGLHLDVARHFFDAETVRRYIDLLALHKLNLCHLHLTDDQGWRFPVERYPRLTEVGGRRAASVIGHDARRPRRYDDTPHGGFFTRDDIRAIVAHAQKRRVTVVPEIDMPGHMQAAMAEEPLAIGGLSTTEGVYAYEPVPAELSEGERGHVLGGQAQLWSEYIPDRAQLEYMAYPRACALAEVLWRPRAEKNYAGFLERLHGHRRRLSALRVNAHPRP